MTEAKKEISLQAALIQVEQMLAKGRAYDAAKVIGVAIEVLTNQEKELEGFRSHDAAKTPTKAPAKTKAKVKTKA